MSFKSDPNWLDLLSRDPRYGVSREKKRVTRMVSEETGGSSWRVVCEVTKLLEPSGRHCPELGGILVGYGDLSISRIQEFQARDGSKSLVEVEGDMFVFNPPDVGQELICQVQEIGDNSLVCYPSAVLEGVRVEVMDLQGVEWRDLYLGLTVVCRVDTAAFQQGEPGLRILGSLVEILTKITVQPRPPGPPLKRPREPGETTNNTKRRRRVSVGSGSPDVVERSSAVENGPPVVAPAPESTAEEPPSGPSDRQVLPEKSAWTDLKDGRKKFRLFSAENGSPAVIPAPETSAPVVPAEEPPKASAPSGSCDQVQEQPKNRSQSETIEGLEGFSTERCEPVKSGVKGKLKSVWIDLKDGRKCFPTIKKALEWVSKNPEYLKNVKQGAGHDTDPTSSETSEDGENKKEAEKEDRSQNVVGEKVKESKTADEEKEKRMFYSSSDSSDDEEEEDSARKSVDEDEEKEKPMFDSDSSDDEEEEDSVKQKVAAKEDTSENVVDEKVKGSKTVDEKDKPKFYSSSDSSDDEEEEDSVRKSVDNVIKRISSEKSKRVDISANSGDDEEGQNSIKPLVEENEVGEKDNARKIVRNVRKEISSKKSEQDSSSDSSEDEEEQESPSKKVLNKKEENDKSNKSKKGTIDTDNDENSDSSDNEAEEDDSGDLSMEKTKQNNCSDSSVNKDKSDQSDTTKADGEGDSSQPKKVDVSQKNMSKQDRSSNLSDEEEEQKSPSKKEEKSESVKSNQNKKDTTNDDVKSDSSDEETDGEESKDKENSGSDSGNEDESDQSKKETVKKDDEGDSSPKKNVVVSRKNMPKQDDSSDSSDGEEEQESQKLPEEKKNESAQNNKKTVKEAGEKSIDKRLGKFMWKETHTDSSDEEERKEMSQKKSLRNKIPNSSDGEFEEKSQKKKKKKKKMKKKGIHDSLNNLLAQSQDAPRKTVTPPVSSQKVNKAKKSNSLTESPQGQDKTPAHGEKKKSVASSRSRVMAVTSPAAGGASPSLRQKLKTPNLSSTLIPGPSRKRSLNTPEGISPINVGKKRVTVSTSLNLFSKYLDNQKEINNSTSVAKERKVKSEKKRNKVPGFMN